MLLLVLSSLQACKLRVWASLTNIGWEVLIGEGLWLKRLPITLIEVMDKLLRFGHTANYDVQGVGRALRFSIPVWILQPTQTLDIKSVIYKPGVGLGYIDIEATIKDLPEPQGLPKVACGLSKDHTGDTRITLKHGVVE